MKQPRRRFSPAIYAGIIARQKSLCGCGCREELGCDPREIQFDHAIELWAGGEDAPDNLRAMKTRHHLRKTVEQTARRAKFKRIEARDGLRLPRMNERQKMLARLMERQRP